MPPTTEPLSEKNEKISADNLRDALASGADVIDVSGSLESSRGVKSIPRLEAFWSVLETERNTPDRSRA